MLKELLSDGALTHYATIGLVLFVTIFLGVTVWVLTRSRGQIRTWAELPLAREEDGPREPR